MYEHVYCTKTLSVFDAISKASIPKGIQILFFIVRLGDVRSQYVV